MARPADRLLRRAPLVLACLAALAPAAARAQPPVQPGARVRVLAPSAADTLLTGTVVAIDSASLLLAAGFDTAGVHVPLAAIRRIEVTADPGDARREGALWGLLAGGAAGYLLVGPCRGIDGCAEVRGAGVVGGAAVGMLLGGMVRRRAAAGRWHPAPVPAAAGPARLHAGTGLVPGSRVRLLAPAAADTLVTGRVVSLDSASLLLATGRDGATRVPFGGITRLETSTGRRSDAGTLGVLGAVVGAAVALSRVDGGPCDGCGVLPVRTLAAAAGAGAGFLVGTLIGRSRTEEGWRPVRVPRDLQP